MTRDATEAIGDRLAVGGDGLFALFEHVAALAALSTAAPVVVLTAVVPGQVGPVHVHHGPAFAAPGLPPGEMPTDAPPRLVDGTRLTFQHAEPLIARSGVQLGTLALFDVVPRGLSMPQKQVVSRLARQAADLAELLRGDTSQTSTAAESPTSAPGTDRATLLDDLADGAIRLDPRGVVLGCNAVALAYLSLSDDAVLGANLWELLPEAVGGPLHEACERVRRLGRPESVDDWFPIRSRLTTTRIVPDGPGVLLIVRDITELRALDASLAAAQAQFRALSQRLRSAQEDERRRISRELHDVVGQDLSVIKLRLEILKKRLNKLRSNQQNVALCQDIIHDTENALAAARRLAQDLRPSILDQLGLSAAIEWQAQELQRRTGIECHVRADAADVRQNTGRDTTAFRVLQELLTNVVRHSEASRVDIHLIENQGSLLLEVQDDGRGFAPAPASTDNLAPPEGLGLLGVRERVGALGGNVEIETTEGKGTCVRITLPPPATEPAE
jgi:signal transduction histidine kinase